MYLASYRASTAQCIGHRHQLQALNPARRGGKEREYRFSSIKRTIWSICGAETAASANPTISDAMLSRVALDQ